MSAKFKFWIKWPSFLGLILYILFEVFVLKSCQEIDISKNKYRYTVAYASRNFYMKPCYYTDFVFKYKGEWITIPEDGTYTIGSKQIFEIVIAEYLPDGVALGDYQFPADSVPPEFLLTLPDTGWTIIPPKIK